MVGDFVIGKYFLLVDEDCVNYDESGGLGDVYEDWFGEDFIVVFVWWMVYDVGIDFFDIERLCWWVIYDDVFDVLVILCFIW